MSAPKTYVDQRGYLRYSDSDYLVHRRVMEKKLGRRLVKGEIVHHKNGDKLDNSSQNLELTSAKEHYKTHVVPILQERRDAGIRERLLTQLEGEVAKTIVIGFAIAGLILLVFGVITGASLKLWYFGLVFLFAAGAAYLVVRRGEES